MSFTVFSGKAAFTQTGQTTTAAQLTLTGSKSVSNNSILSFIIRITAIEPATGAGYCHELRGTIKNIGGTTSLVDTITDEQIAEDAGAVNWSVDAAANDGSDVLDILVTGEAGKTIIWKSETAFSEIKF